MKNICIIGLGQQSKELYLPAALVSKEVNVLGVMSTTKDNVAIVSQETGIKGYTNLQAMLDACSPDFVIAMVPHDQYLPIIQEVAKRGIHILKGKPFAKNLEEAKEFAMIIHTANIQCMMTLPRRYNPVYIAAYNNLHTIGKVFFSEFYSTLGLDNPIDIWRGSKLQSGGGCILDMGYHMIDVLLWFLGMPTDISAIYSANARPEIRYDTEDTASIQYAYNNAYGNMVLSRVIPPKTEILRFAGQDGTIEINNNTLTIYSKNGKVLYNKSFTIDKQEIAKTQIELFCKILDKEATNIETPEYNLQHMEFIETCYSSKKL